MLVGALIRTHGAVGRWPSWRSSLISIVTGSQAGERVHQPGGVAADAVVAPRGDVPAVEDYEPHTNSRIAAPTAAGAS